MTLTDYITQVFCDVDDLIREQSLQNVRQRGPRPQLADSELLTMEVVGESLGIDTDQGIWRYFRSHFRSLFPRVGSRTAFLRQAANLWAVKQKLQQAVSRKLGAWQDTAFIIDGLPIPVCQCNRLYRARCFKGEAALSYCRAKRLRYFGFRGMLLVTIDGTIRDFTFTAANIDERTSMWDLLTQVHGLVLADRGFIGKFHKSQLVSQGIDLHTSLRRNMKKPAHDIPTDWARLLGHKRQLIETVVSQLAERFHFEKVRARDLWHLTSRLWRKLLAHTLALWTNKRLGRPLLQLDGLFA